MWSNGHYNGHMHPGKLEIIGPSQRRSLISLQQARSTTTGVETRGSSPSCLSRHYTWMWTDNYCIFVCLCRQLQWDSQGHPQSMCGGRKLEGDEKKLFSFLQNITEMTQLCLSPVSSVAESKQTNNVCAVWVFSFIIKDSILNRAWFNWAPQMNQWWHFSNPVLTSWAAFLPQRLLLSGWISNE